MESAAEREHREQMEKYHQHTDTMLAQIRDILADIRQIEDTLTDIKQLLQTRLPDLTSGEVIRIAEKVREALVRQAKETPFPPVRLPHVRDEHDPEIDLG